MGVGDGRPEPLLLPPPPPHLPLRDEARRVCCARLQMSHGRWPALRTRRSRAGMGKETERERRRETGRAEPGARRRRWAKEKLQGRLQRRRRWRRMKGCQRLQ